jgi:hypothetical protein
MWLVNGTGNVYIRAKTGEDSIKAVPDGAVSLYYDNEERFKTTDGGTIIYRDNEIFNFIERTGTGADNNWLGCHIFKGMNDASQSTEFAKILAGSPDVSDGSEDGKLLLQTAKAGTLATSLELESGYAVTPNAPYALLGIDASQSVANTTSHTVDWVETTDRGGDFDTSNERFTAPVAGDYLICLSIQYTQNVDQLHTGILKNNAGPAASFDPWVNWGDDTRAGCTSTILTLAVNDYITLQTYQNTGSAKNLETNRTKATIRFLG